MELIIKTTYQSIVFCQRQYLPLLDRQFQKLYLLFEQIRIFQEGLSVRRTDMFFSRRVCLFVEADTIFQESLSNKHFFKDGLYLFIEQTLYTSSTRKRVRVSIFNKMKKYVKNYREISINRRLKITNFVEINRSKDVKQISTDVVISKNILEINYFYIRIIFAVFAVYRKIKSPQNF